MTVGQQTSATRLAGQFPRWLDAVGAAVVVLSLPVVYPLLYLELLRPQETVGLVALVAVCVVNSAIVALAVRWVLGRGRFVGA
ncbi:MAG TPA: hypothetical protein VF322_00410 [Gammaproteobacteria bacterium]